MLPVRFAGRVLQPRGPAPRPAACRVLESLALATMTAGPGVSVDSDQRHHPEVLVVAVTTLADRRSWTTGWAAVTVTAVLQ